MNAPRTQTEEEKRIQQLAIEYSDSEAINYEKEHPFPPHYPEESKMKLMAIFKNQCYKNFMAGYNAKA